MPSSLDLDRLAEDLERRELLDKPSLDQADLPVHIPLSHSNPYLTAPTFTVEHFLLSRVHDASPADIRVELREYLASLKEELVRLINDDYAAFISLSSDLRGEGTRLESLKSPLAMLKKEVLVSRGELQAIQDAIQHKLHKRAELRDEKTILHLLLKISESVTRLEALLLIAAPTADPKLPSHLNHVDDPEDKTRTNRAKHLARVATEYRQLLYHVSKAKEKSCKFVDEINWRIDRIRSTLSTDLDNLFSTTLISLDSKISDGEKVKLTADLTECLRTYDTLGLWRDAENVLRRDIVGPFVKKTIFSGALTAPPSPLVPKTPRQPIKEPKSAFPHTPYTPYTAFVTKRNPFLSSSIQSTPLLDESEDSLAVVYNQLTRFVDRDVSQILSISEHVSSSPSGGFQIMGNVVAAEFLRAIMDELGNVIFAAGRPDEFRRHHETTQAFLRTLEYQAPSTDAVDFMRTHDVYEAFQKRWQLPVYFQLRWKSIVEKLEEDMSSGSIEVAHGHAPFATKQAAATWAAITTCWSADYFIPQLCHRFWKLTLQILSRYTTWLDKSLPHLEPAPKVAAALAAEKLNSTGRSASAPPVEGVTPESLAAEDSLLRQCGAALVDVAVLQSQSLTLYREVIFGMLPDQGDDENSSISQTALNNVLSSMDSLVPPISTQVLTILTRRACDALTPVRSILSQFRASPNKNTPSEPSPFVASILLPVRTFFDKGNGGEHLQEDLMKACTADVFENVCSRYIYHLTAIKKTEDSLRRLKKGQRSTFSLFGNSNAATADSSRRDEERMRSQMIIDLDALAADAKSLHVKVGDSESYQALRQMVEAEFLIDT